jgi:hypothetical protein
MSFAELKDCKQSLTFFLLKIGALESMSSTFYAHIFVRKQIEKLSIVTFQPLYFCRQNIGAKFSCKMLMKLTPGVEIGLHWSIICS